ncbi:MAG TPA: OmpA family protein [Chitinophagaceae bacterium]|jgi:outer membrane protein OmpA-like peptidoglycan-associated protein|nr:OmpA family protein [Chitinophagaceae bacterium]
MKLSLLCLSMFLIMTGECQESKSFTIHFDFNKHELTPTAREQLDSFILAEKTGLGNLSIALSGHCDAIGSDEYNNKLSKRRVTVVKQYLLSKDIGAYQIGDEIGHGKKNPLNENKTEEERQLNRRVEVNFIRIVRTYPPGTTSLIDKISDTSITTGSKIVLQNINFVGGRHQFLDESLPMLEELLDVMRTYPNLVIRVEGHICCQEGNIDGFDLETKMYNLSTARAKAVRDYLVRSGVHPDRVSYIGFGHSVPLHPYPERSEEEKTENRRVEIKIIQK